MAQIVYPQEHDLIVANGATQSEVLNITARQIVGVQTGAEFDGLTIQFEVSRDQTTWVALVDPDTGSAVAIAAGPSEAYAVDPALTKAWKYVRLVVGVQGGASTLYVTTMPTAA
jgi:hypothetical protein